MVFAPKPLLGEGCHSYVTVMCIMTLLSHENSCAVFFYSLAELTYSHKVDLLLLNFHFKRNNIFELEIFINICSKTFTLL